jgi:peptidoglycan lytic transglycosylase
MKQFLLITFLLISYFGFSQSGFPEFGKASFYADKFVGKLTASGEKYKHNDLTAAHKSLPFGTKVRVTNLTNGKSITVRINDRGPFVENRVIDLSKKAAEKIDFIEIGIVDVKLELLNAGQPKTKNIPKKEVIPYSEFKYYQVNSKLIEPNHYGIQIGSFSDSGNLLRSISDFNLKYPYQVFVQESVSNGNRKYRLIIGNFKDRNEAESKLEELRKEFADCYVLNLD